MNDILGNIKDRYLREVASYNPEKYREEISGEAGKYSVQYTNQDFLANLPVYSADNAVNFEAIPDKDSNKKRNTIIAVSLVLLIAGAGTVYLYKTGKLSNK